MEKRYFTSINYNLARVIRQLQTVVENNGGYIASRKDFNSYSKEYEIHNRTVMEAIRDAEFQIATITEMSPSEIEKTNQLRQRRLDSLKAQVEKLKQDQPESFVTHFLQSITFVYDGKLYYFCTDDNPFFPFHYQKTDINEKGEINCTYLEEFSKEGWMFDCLFEQETTESDIREIANIVFNKLVSAEDTEAYYEVGYKNCPYCGRRMKYNKGAKIETYEKVEL